MRTAARLAVCAGALLLAGGADGQVVGGQIRYTGALGPVGREHPLCLCLFVDAQLTNGVGCLILFSNPAPYAITLGEGPYYLVAFVDLHINEILDPDEPFEIYHDRSTPPGDPVSGPSGAMDIDFDFGDESVPSTPTPTATESSVASPSATPTPTPSTTPTETAPATVTATAPPTPLDGDCDGDGSIAIAELIRAVAIALGTLDLATCPAIDADRDGIVRVAELIRAVNAALGPGI